MMNDIDMLVESLKELSKKYGQNKTDLICKVKTAPPNITLEYEKIIIPTPQIMVANNLLLEYNRKFRAVGTINNIKQDSLTYDFSNTTSTSTASSHTHAIATLSGTGEMATTEGSFDIQGDITLKDTLEVGSEVLVKVVNNTYIVICQVVRMPSNARSGA